MDRGSSAKDLKSSFLNTASSVWHSSTTQSIAGTIKKKTGVDLNPVGKYLPPKNSSSSSSSQPQPGHAGASQPQQHQVPVGYSQALPPQFTVPHGHAPYGHQAQAPFAPAPLSPHATSAPPTPIVSPQPVQSSGQLSVQSPIQPPATTPSPTFPSEVPYKPRPSKWVQKLSTHNAYLSTQGGVAPQPTGGSLTAGLQSTGTISPPPQHPLQAPQAGLAQQFSQVSLNTTPLPPPPQHPSRPPARPTQVSPSPAAATIPAATAGAAHNIYAPPLQATMQQQCTGLTAPPLPPNRPSSAPPVPTQQSPVMVHQSPPAAQQPAQSYFAQQPGMTQSPPQQWMQPQSPPLQHAYPAQQEWQQQQQMSPDSQQQPGAAPPQPVVAPTGATVPSQQITPTDDLNPAVPSDAPPPYALEAAPGTSAPAPVAQPPSPPPQQPQTPQQVSQPPSAQPVQPQSAQHPQPMQQQWPDEKWLYKQAHDNATATAGGSSSSGAGSSLGTSGPSGFAQPQATVVQAPLSPVTTQPPSEVLFASQMHSPPSPTGDAEYDARMARIYALEMAQHEENMRLQHQQQP